MSRFSSLPRAIAWPPGQGDDDANLEFGGWISRYDLEPVGDGRTKVTLTYDWSAVPPALREHIEFPPFDGQHPGQLAQAPGRAGRGSGVAVGRIDTPAGRRPGGNRRGEPDDETAGRKLGGRWLIEGSGQEPLWPWRCRTSWGWPAGVEAADLVDLRVPPPGPVRRRTPNPTDFRYALFRAPRG